MTSISHQSRLETDLFKSDLHPYVVLVKTADQKNNLGKLTRQTID